MPMSGNKKPKLRKSTERVPFSNDSSNNLIQSNSQVYSDISGNSEIISQASNSRSQSFSAYSPSMNIQSENLPIELINENVNQEFIDEYK